MEKTGRYLHRLIMPLVPPLAAAALACLAGFLLIPLTGDSPIQVYSLMLRGAFGTIDGIAYTLFLTVPLIFTGLAVAVGFQAGLFNIGVEGQLYVGSLACAWVAFSFGGLPAAVLLPLSVLAAMAGGAAWGLVPGYLKVRFGSHEVINTIMMNFIALALCNYLVVNHFMEPGHMAAQTIPISPQAAIPRIGPLFGLPPSNPLNYSIFLAGAALILIYIFLYWTDPGFQLRAVGKNPRAAAVAGISTGAVTIGAMALSGALAGLVGVNEVLGYRGRYLDNFSAGLGFTGIAVALLGRNHPAGVVVAALFFGFLNSGSLEVGLFSNVPRELILVLQGVVILGLLFGQGLAGRIMNLFWAGRAGRSPRGG